MTIPTRWIGPVALAAALGLAGCGGGGGDAPAAAPPDIARDVSALVDFISSLIAGTSETSEPIDIDALTLAVDDTAEPAPL
ncbi:hypothetical protein O4H66_02090 [Comamonadaceae bacterium G21597-S1]|nr:hypothetical protein [Comamonadaceae bacterium G21597-S1]